MICWKVTGLGCSIALLSAYSVGLSLMNCDRELSEQKVNLEEDSIRFYPVSRHTLGQVEVLGVGAPVTKAPGSVII